MITDGIQKTCPTYVAESLQQKIHLGKEIGYLARVEDVVDVFEEGFVLELGVAEQEGRRLELRPGLLEHPPQVLTPLDLSARRTGVGVRDLGRRVVLCGGEAHICGWCFRLVLLLLETLTVV